MSALAVISTNDSGFADISSEVINPAGQSEQYADGVVQPEWLQNCHANQNKFRDDIASKKTELTEALDRIKSDNHIGGAVEQVRGELDLAAEDLINRFLNPASWEEESKKEES